MRESKSQEGEIICTAILGMDLGGAEVVFFRPKKDFAVIGM